MSFTNAAFGASTTVRASWRRSKSLLVVVAVMGGYLAFGAPASAVHDAGLFELEGDAVNDANLVGDDWDNVCHEVTVTNDATDDEAGDNVINDIPNQCTGAGDTTGATAVSWASDGALNASIFTGGGSKDPSDVPNWAWKDDAGGLPDKSNLLHSFAARYSAVPSATCPSGGTASCDVLYFGSDRYDNSGDAQQGFWFFQEEITLGTPGVDKVGGGTGFKGDHMNGDLLIVTDFSNGGEKSTISVYEWNTSCLKAGGECADANLERLETSTSAKCTTVAAGDSFCGIVNPANGTAAPWSFQDKTPSSEAHPANTYLNGEFYEGGINLSALGLSDRCFSSVLSETRTSTSTDAVLKDFVLGGFGSCETTLVTTPKQGDGNAIPLTGLSIGTGSVTAKDSAVLTVSGVATWSGSLQFYLCGPIAAPGTCETGGLAIGSPMAVNQSTGNPILAATAATITSVGRYCWRADFTSPTEGVPDASDSSTGECFTVVPVTPSLSTAVVSTPVAFGQALGDNATLSSAATRPGTDGPNTDYPSINATPVAIGGKITYTLVKSDCSTLATGTGTNPQDIAVTSGNTTYGPATFTPDSPGTYHWKAQYFPATGDPNNLSTAVHNSDCTVSNEQGVVSPVEPTVVTRQFVFPQDKTSIAASAGGPLAGTVTFRLYDNLANCQANVATAAGGLLYSEAIGPFSGASPQTKTTNNTSYRVTENTTVVWRVSYVSTNPNHSNKESICSETTAVTYSGNDAGISIP